MAKGVGCTVLYMPQIHNTSFGLFINAACPSMASTVSDTAQSDKQPWHVHQIMSNGFKFYLEHTVSFQSIHI